MPDGRITDEELEELVQRTEEATSAFMLWTWTATSRSLRTPAVSP